MLKISIIPFLLLGTYFYILPDKAFSREEISIIEKQFIKQVEKKPLTVKEIIKVKGAEYNVSPRLMEEIIWCESSGSTTIQSKHRYKHSRYGPVNSREESWGAVQWHIPAGNKKKDGTVITKEDALDPEIAIDTMAWYISKGKAHIWSCYPIALQKIKVDNKSK